MVKIQSFFKKNQLALFFLIAFGYTWIFQLMIGVLAPERGQDLVLFIPSIYGPTLAALLVPLLTDGIHGLAEFLKTRLTWKVNLLWYLIAILFIPTLLLVLRGVHLLIFPEISLGSLSIDRSLLQVISGFLMMLTFGPLAEELGWRGFAIPKLQEKMNALIASVVFGVIWWAWHLPQLLTPALQWSVGGMPVFIYLLTILPGSILATWIVNNSRGSVLPVILFHASMNFFMGLLGFESPMHFS